MTDLPRYAPTGLLRNPHVQSMLASGGLRRYLFRQRAHHLESAAEPWILDGGDGIRLKGFMTRQTLHARARGLVVLFHGWEGSVESSYLLVTAGSLVDAGFDVFRLNFRDHGDTHDLNAELFHSCRIDEVVNAVADLYQREPRRPLILGGFSLGGNFALRVALRAPGHGIEAAHVIAVSPVISPHASLRAIERAPWFYESYFLLKWRESLRRKRSLFPELYEFSDRDLRRSLRDLTSDLATRYSGFADLDSYLNGYSVAGTRLAELRVPATLITAADDPVIPVDDFRSLRLPASAELLITKYGGHCGFIERLPAYGWIERAFVQRCLRTAGVPFGEVPHSADWATHTL